MQRVHAAASVRDDQRSGQDPDQRDGSPRPDRTQRVLQGRCATQLDHQIGALGMQVFAHRLPPFRHLAVVDRYVSAKTGDPIELAV